MPKKERRMLERLWLAHEKSSHIMAGLPKDWREYKNIRNPAERAQIKEKIRALYEQLPKRQPATKSAHRPHSSRRRNSSWRRQFA